MFLFLSTLNVYKKITFNCIILIYGIKYALEPLKIIHLTNMYCV